MRCHSCDGWVEKHMRRRPICGWRVDSRAEEPPPALPKSTSRRAPTFSTRTITKEVHRLVTIGMYASYGACRNVSANEASQKSGKGPEPKQCCHLEAKLLAIDCLFGARCELIDPLPIGAEWRMTEPRREDGYSRTHSRPCPPRWKQLTMLGIGSYVARCTKHVRVREIRTQVVQES